jgi:copper chaperone CopZ
MSYRYFLMGAGLFMILGIGAFIFRDGATGASPALAELSVGNLSCGSCVANVQRALAPLAGVGRVQVSLTSGRAQVEFDPARIEVDAIAGAITQAGYPSGVKSVLTADEYSLSRKDEVRMAQSHVARIGERLVSRQEFDEELARHNFSGTTADAPAPLLQTAWREFLQRELLMAAAERNEVIVQEGEIDLELERLRSRMEGFDSLVEARYGGIDPFRKILKEDLIIRRNIDEFVLHGENDSTLRQLKLEQWYRSLVESTPVVLFDAGLKAAVGGSGGGCACCG